MRLKDVAHKIGLTEAQVLHQEAQGIMTLEAYTEATHRSLLGEGEFVEGRDQQFESQQFERLKGRRPFSASGAAASRPLVWTRRGKFKTEGE